MSVPAKYCRYVRSPTTCTRYGESWRPLSMPRGMWGGFAIWESNGAYNTVDTNVGAYNTVCVRAVVEHYSRRCTGYDPLYRGLTCALPSLFTPGPFRVDVSGRMAPVGSSHASRRRAASRLPTGPRSESRGRNRKQHFGPGLLIGETALRRLVPEASALVGEAGRRI